MSKELKFRPLNQTETIKGKKIIELTVKRLKSSNPRLYTSAQHRAEFFSDHTNPER